MVSDRMKTLLYIILFISSYSVYGQNEKTLIKKGNSEYNKKNYSEAELNYRKSLEKNPQSATGSYNLGNALYKQGKQEEAEQYFSGSAAMEKDKAAQAEALFNLGNSKLKAEKYEESISAYKQALKLNDKDEEARYNLAYALSKLKKQQQQQQQNKDKKQDQKKDQEQKKDQQQQEQKQDQQKQQQEQQQQQAQKKEKISKEDAERMLQALKNDEKKLQKKLVKKYDARMGGTDKDW